MQKITNVLQAALEKASGQVDKQTNGRRVLHRALLHGSKNETIWTIKQHMWCSARFGTIYKLKSVKNTHGGVLLLVKQTATLLKVTVLCCSRF